MLIGFLTKLIKTITLRSVLLWSLAAIAIVVFYTAFENRDEIFSTGQSSGRAGNPVGLEFTIGNQTKKQIAEFVESDKTIVGFAILSADVRLNSRKSIFFYADSKDLKSASPSQALPINRLPLFTNSIENNRQIIKLINGEFVCSPYGTSQLARSAPEINPGVITICRASLPPYYGYFSGFITVFLNTDPSVDQQVLLKNQLESLATEIYFRDVVPTSKKIPF